MDKEFLLWARNRILSSLNNPNANSKDLAELKMFLFLILDPDNYEPDKEVLMKYSKIYERNREKKFQYIKEKRKK